MMFEDFARLHGVVVGRIAPGRWVRCATEDKPKHKNGAFKHMGTWALVQNWATMTEPAIWRAEGESTQAQRRVQEVANKAAQEALVLARNAAHKAQTILGESELATHPYLASKGFPDEMGNVWRRETDNVLVVPMRRGAHLVGLQLIRPDGDKRFLYGQRSGGAEFVIGQRGMNVLCEGFATALSVRQALRNLKIDAALHCTFSAGNMKKVADGLPVGLVIADNDASGTGERVAREIGWPYWMSDTVGEDANDYSQRAGVFALAMGIKRAMAVRRRA